jgi:hypothetical protein
MKQMNRAANDFSSRDNFLLARFEAGDFVQDLLRNLGIGRGGP